MLYILLVIFVKLPLCLIMMPRLYGRRENLRIKGGVIFVCNHLSQMDPVALCLISPRIIHFMAKKELFETKIGRLFFKSLFVFPVSRKSADVKSIKNAISMLSRGKAFGIFPEGKRSVTGSLDEIEKGPAFIAVKSGAPVVPIYLSPNEHGGAIGFRAMVGDVIRVGDAAERRPDMKPVDAVTAEIQASLEELQLRMKLRGLKLN